MPSSLNVSGFTSLMCIKTYRSRTCKSRIGDKLDTHNFKKELVEDNDDGEIR